MNSWIIAFLVWQALNIGAWTVKLVNNTDISKADMKLRYLIVGKSVTFFLLYMGGVFSV